MQKGAGEGNFSAEIRGFVSHCSRPEICDRLRAVGIWRIVLTEILLPLLFYLRADLAKLVGEFRAVTWDVFEHDLENQTCDRVEIAREGVASQPERLQRNRSATCEGIDHQRRFVSMRRLHQSPSNLEVAPIRGQIPIRKITDELEKLLATIDVLRSRLALHIRQ